MAYKYLVGPLGWPCSGSIFIPGGSPIGFSVEDLLAQPLPAVCVW